MKKLVSGIVTLYHYDYAGNLIAETDGDGTPLRDYIYLNGEIIAMKVYGSQAGWYYFVNDHLGTPHKLVSASGEIVWAAAYLPFGEAQIITETVADNFRFPGQYYDAETGLCYNWHRYYDPKTGRYLTPDPIGLEGGINLYVYVMGNPVNFIDQEGLINITKLAVGIINIVRGFSAGLSGATVAVISIVAVGSGVGLPFGILTTAYSVYKLTLAFPGLTKRGLQQTGESLDEFPGEISFGYWKNLRGLGPLGQDVDDPCETYSEALEKKKKRLEEVRQKMVNNPKEALYDLWKWLQDWAF